MFQLKLKLLCFLLCWLLALVILSQPNMINTNPVKTETCQVQFSLTRVFQQKVATLALFYHPLLRWHVQPGPTVKPALKEKLLSV